MDVHLMHDLKKYQDWVTINGDYEQFHIWGDNEDYVEDTIVLMQKAATKCFNFPFYIHFEGYDDEIDSILSKRDQFEICYQNTGRTVLTMFNGKTYHAEIPAFTVTITNNQCLKAVFAQWFYLAQHNNMWLITQSSNLYYKNKFASIDISHEPIILLPDHDAQSLSFITNKPIYQEAYLQAIFEE